MKKSNNNNSYVRIKLIFQENEYDVDVNKNSTPDELIKLFAEKFSVQGFFRLIPITSVNLINDSIWELSEVPPPSKIKAFTKII